MTNGIASTQTLPFDNNSTNYVTDVTKKERNSSKYFLENIGYKLLRVIRSTFKGKNNDTEHEPFF